MGFALLQLLVQQVSQLGITLPVAYCCRAVAHGLGGNGAASQYVGVVAVEGVGTHLRRHFVVGGQHLVVVTQQTPGRRNELAAIECVPIGAFLEERKIIPGGVGLVCARSVGMCHISLSLCGVVVAVALAVLVVVLQAVGVGGIVGMVLAVVAENVHYMLSQRYHFLFAAELAQHLYLALEGYDAGVHLVGLALPVEACNHPVELVDTFLFVTQLHEQYTHPGLGAQCLGLSALAAAQVGLLGSPAQTLLVVVLLARGVGQQVEHYLAVVGVMDIVANHQALKHLACSVEILHAVRLAVDLGFEQGGEVVVDVAHEACRVDNQQGPLGVLVVYLHGRLGGVERVRGLRLATVLVAATGTTGCHDGQ